jgi:acylphosphatase
MKKVKIRVIGKVQGVFFRMYTKKRAKELNLSGWVRNEEDGSVLIMAAGEDKQIEQLISWCHQGSPWSKVLRVEVKDEVGLIDNEGFEVK